MRARYLISSLGCVGAISALLFGLLAGTSFAQQIDVTPATSITPSSHVTTWVFQMAIAAAVLGVLILIGLGLGYLRFAPKFFGREEKPAPGPPGTRPPTLVRQAAAVRWTPPAATGHAASGPASPAPARAATATATAVAERPAPSRGPAAAEAPAPEAPAAEAPAAAAASVTPTAGPSGEPAGQADAVGEAEAAAPEPRPTAKTQEETGAPAAEAPAPLPTAATTRSPAPAAASHGASASLDQETFDRVLEEQLAKGVDRRVAEGRARAAAVVAARKKSQG